MAIMQRAWGSVKGLAGLVLPMFAGTRDARGMGQHLRWVLHFSLVGCILLFLTFVNYVLDLQKLLNTPLPFLRPFWLPLLFLIIYLLMWLGWWLWILLGAEERSSYPDLDAAWEEAVAALGHAQIDVREVPLFLILGRPAGSSRSLLGGAQLNLTVEHVPSQPEAPFHVYGGPDGIFVTCDETSLLGKQAILLNVEEEVPAQPSPRRESEQSDETSRSSVQLGEKISEGMGQSPRGGIRSFQSVAAMPALPSSPEVSVAVESEGRVALGGDRPRVRRGPIMLLKDSAEVELRIGRLKHLCWLIVKERRPYCPVNGVLVCIPARATRTDVDATQTGLICQRDLAIVQEVFQVQCPTFTLVCDMERAPGFREFVDRFPKGHRQRRLGQQFPYVENLSPADAGSLIEQGTGWICSDLFPPLVYRLMRPEKTSHDKMAAVIRGNARLYHLMHQMWEHRERLSRILIQAISTQPEGAILLGGCYLAGTGRNAAHEQAFIAAVFNRLVESQNFVAWSPRARADEADYRRWKLYGYAAVTVFVIAIFTMGFYFRRQ